MNQKTCYFIPFVILTFMHTASYSQGVWAQKANFGGGSVSEATAFSIGNKGYAGAATADLWEYDQATDTWTQKAAFIGGVRLSAAGFSIGTKGYFGTGGSLNDFYEWDQVSNTWTQKANFGGSGREGAIGFATSTKGYIGTGGNYLTDLWEYDPLLNSWTQVASLPGPGRYHAAAFSIADKGYVCTGFNGIFLNDLWEYDPATNSWTQLANLPGSTRDRPEGFAIGNKGYIGVGWNGSSALNDFYEWDQPTNTWTALPNFAGVARYNAISFAIGSKGYIGTGTGNGQDFWEYGSNCSLQAASQNTTCPGVCDGSATVTLPAPGAVFSYSWNTIPVQTTQTATGLCAAAFIITMTDTSGCINSYSVTVSQPATITATAAITQPSCFGLSNGSLCAISSGGSGTFTGYLWSNAQTTTCATGISGGTYTVTVTDDAGCTGSTSLVLAQPSQMVATLTHTNASCATCANGNATANIQGGNGPYQFSWSNGVTNSAFITNLLPGVYTCCVTDANGCSVCDSTIVSSTAAISETGWFESVNFSPNPFDDYIQLDFATPVLKNISFSITDITGRIYLSGSLPDGKEVRLNTQPLEKGIYFLEINMYDKKGILKLVKYSN